MVLGIIELLYMSNNIQQKTTNEQLKFYFNLYIFLYKVD